MLTGTTTYSNCAEQVCQMSAITHVYSLNYLKWPGLFPCETKNSQDVVCCEFLPVVNLVI